jgi:hypothetical protein
VGQITTIGSRPGPSEVGTVVVDVDDVVVDVVDPDVVDDDSVVVVVVDDEDVDADVLVDRSLLVRTFRPSSSPITLTARTTTASTAAADDRPTSMRRRAVARRAAARRRSILLRLSDGGDGSTSDVRTLIASRSRSSALIAGSPGGR